MAVSMIRRIAVALVGLLVAINWSPAARAEIFHLTTGGTIEGKLLNTLSDPSPRYVIKTSTGRIVLETSSVVRIEQKSEL